MESREMVLMNLFLQDRNSGADIENKSVDKEKEEEDETNIALTIHSIITSDMQTTPALWQKVKRN